MFKGLDETICRVFLDSFEFTLLSPAGAGASLSITVVDTGYVPSEVSGACAAALLSCNCVYIYFAFGSVTKAA